MATCSSCGKETDVKSYVIEVGNQKQSKILCQGCAECVEKSGIRIYEGTYSQNTGLTSIGRDKTQIQAIQQATVLHMPLKAALIMSCILPE